MEHYRHHTLTTTLIMIIMMMMMMMMMMMNGYSVQHPARWLTRDRSPIGVVKEQ